MAKKIKPACSNCTHYRSPSKANPGHKCLADPKNPTLASANRQNWGKCKSSGLYFEEPKKHGPVSTFFRNLFFWK